MKVKLLIAVGALCASALVVGGANGQIPSSQTDCVHYHTRPKACGPEVKPAGSMTINLTGAQVANLPKQTVNGQQMVLMNGQWSKLVASGAGNYTLVASGAGN